MFPTHEGFNMKSFMASVFSQDSMMFEYMGLQTPAFDTQERFHLFATREEETPMQQRATQIYFD